MKKKLGSILGKMDGLTSLFLVVFLLGAVYISFIESERYVSSARITIKDLTFGSSTGDATSLASLLTQISPVSKDAHLMEVYSRSHDMYRQLDREVNLTAYYTGKALDFWERLYPEATGTIFECLFGATKVNLLERYNKDLMVIYDDLSGTVQIEFANVDPHMAQKVVREIIAISSKAINRIERENAEETLRYLRKQLEINKKRFTDAISKMIVYQNTHDTINPTTDVESKSQIIAQLEGELIQKEVEYKSKLKYKNRNFPEMGMLRDSIANLKKSIAKLRGELVSKGKKKSDGRREESANLNRNVFEFEILKSQMDFAKQLYTQSLVKLEELKVLVQQNSKNLIVVSSPTLPDEYTYPEKFKSILSLAIVLLFLYGVLKGTMTIIRDHQD